MLMVSPGTVYYGLEGSMLPFCFFGQSRRRISRPTSDRVSAPTKWPASSTSSAAERPRATLLETECLVLDMRMPGMDGLELQRRLSISDADVPIIFVAAHDDRKSTTGH
jgi:CheY-like chemotaxis protein